MSYRSYPVTGPADFTAIAPGFPARGGWYLPFLTQSIRARASGTLIFLASMPARPPGPHGAPYHHRVRAQRGVGFLADRNPLLALDAFVLSAQLPGVLAGLPGPILGQLAWIVEKFKEWTDPATDLPEDAVDRDQLLTNVSLYWLTDTAGSSARLYYEGAQSWGQIPVPFSDVPTGVAVFPMDITIRNIAEREHNIVHWSEFGRGGHFAAMEAPDLLTTDVRDFFRLLR